MKVSEIGNELTKIWDSLEQSNKMRASLFNLIVFTPKNSRTDYVKTITRKVLERFPSRVIFAMIDKNLSSESLEASVSIIPSENPDIVCDFIEIDASKQSQAKIPFILLPHLLPDLPVYLLWTEDPVKDNPISHKLEEWTTRIIFDSEVTDNLPAFAKSVLQHQKVNHCDIADLNWARTESWRELLSSTFYSEARIKALQEAKIITLTYNSFETESFCHTKIQALYLQSWLATQLGWKLTKAASGAFEYGSLRLTLKAERRSDLPPGTVISIEILSQSQIHYSLVRDKDHPHQINTIICDEEKCDIPSKFVFTKSQSGLSLVNEICHTGTSPHFKKVLEFLSPMDPQCLC